MSPPAREQRKKTEVGLPTERGLTRHGEGKTGWRETLAFGVLGDEELGTPLSLRLRIFGLWDTSLRDVEPGCPIWALGRPWCAQLCRRPHRAKRRQSRPQKAPLSLNRQPAHPQPAGGYTGSRAGHVTQVWVANRLLSPVLK